MTAPDAASETLPRRMTRVAVVQLDYLPAVPGALDNPLFDLASTGGLEPPGGLVPPALRERFTGLQERLRAAYIAALETRLTGILAGLRALEVQVVLFPEYAVPAELLPSLARHAGDMVVVAGTHFVDQGALDAQTDSGDSVYAALGASPPAFRSAVAPVLEAGRLVGLVGKLSASKWERTPPRELLPAETWAPAELGRGLGPLGVLVCLDFLDREGPGHRAVVGGALARCRFLAVPSLTRAHTIEAFAAKAREEARRYRRPVLYANSSHGGGSAVFVDEKHHPLTPFPEHPGVLAAGEEGVVVADVDLGYEPRAESTPYDYAPPIRPVANASLAYGGSEPEYRLWLDEVASLVEGDGTELERLRQVPDVIARAPTQPGSPETRRFRLDRLAQQRRPPSLEWVRQLTRELVLPDEVLRAPQLCAALASGAADVMDRWHDDRVEGATAFAPVRDRLRQFAAGRRLDRKATATAKAERAVREHVQGNDRPLVPGAVPQLLALYSPIVDGALGREIGEADDARRAGRFAEARARYEEALEKTERLASCVADGARQQQVAKIRIRAAICAVNLQDLAGAKALVQAVGAAHLGDADRLVLVDLLVCVGEIDGAEALLSTADGLAPELHGRRDEVLQAIEIGRGRVPQKLASSASLELRAAQLLVERHDLDGGAAHARVALELEAGALVQAVAASTLFRALWGTVHEAPPRAVFIEVPQRALVLAALDSVAERLDLAGVPEPVRGQAAAALRGYAVLAGTASADGPPTRHDENADAVLVRARHHARGGELEQGLALYREWLAASPIGADHPWHVDLGRVDLLVEAGRLGEAVDAALALQKAYEGRPLIERQLALTLERAGRLAEASTHAQLAAEALPTVGNLRYLAELLVKLERHADAWHSLAPARESRRKDVVQWLAIAAERARPSEAPALWRRFLGLGGPPQARVRLAIALLHVDERRQAADEAWRAFQETASVLDLDEIRHCALCQQAALELGEELARRVSAIADYVRKRFPGDPRAEGLRFVLLSTTEGLPPLEAPLDAGLLERAGFRSVPLEQAAAFLRQEQDVELSVRRLYRAGAVPLETYCAETQTFLAEVVGSAVRGAGRFFFCAPVAVEERHLSLDGATLLVGYQELVWLAALGLDDAIIGALGPAGTLVLSPGTRALATRDAAALAQRARPQALRELDDFLARIASWPGVTDPDVAVIVEPEPRSHPRAVAASALLDFLLVQGRITGEDRDAIERRVGRVPGSAFPSDAGTVAVDAQVLHALFERGSLDAVVRELQGSVAVWQRDGVLGLRAHYESVRDAKELADRTLALAARCGDAAPPSEVPRVPEITPAAAARDRGGVSRLVQEPLRAALEHVALLLENPAWRRLACNSFGVEYLGAPATARLLAWSADDYLYHARRARLAAVRTLHLPEIVRLLAPDPRVARRHLLRLASAGFADALDATELLWMHTEGGGIDKPEQAQRLDATEWMAREPWHPSADLARLRIAQQYAGAIVDSHVADGWVAALGEGARSFVAALLGRAERLAAVTRTNMLEHVISLAGLTTAGRPEAVWLQQGNQASRSGRALDLWRVIADWAGPDGGRSRARARAAREVWGALDHRPDGPSILEAGAVALVGEGPMRETEGVTVSLLDADLETLSILSACWKERPLRQNKLVLEDAGGAVATLDLEQALTRVERAAVVELDARRCDFAVTVVADRRARFRAPVEAVLLRGGDELVTWLLPLVRRLQGPNDGRAVLLLDALAADPSSAEARHAYARRSATALWRLVRDDPSYLAVWPEVRGFAVGAERPELSSLRRILSEPPVLERDPESNFAELIDRRMGKEGPWHARDDWQELWDRSTELPGDASCVGAWIELERTADYGISVARALADLERPDDQPSARLARRVAFLWLAASHQPLVTLSQGPVDLRVVAPARTAGLLDLLDKAPSPGSLAEHEPVLLRACVDVVLRLAGPAPMDSREALWLGYRLFQWLCAQLEAMPAAERRDGMARLAALAPAPRPPIDVVDPFGFGPDAFDYRRACVLYAMTAAAAIRDEVLSDGQDSAEATARKPPRAVWSSAIAERLAKIASAPIEGSSLRASLTVKLGWRFPVTTPELALTALLRSDLRAFAGLTRDARLRYLGALPSEVTPPDDWSGVASLVVAAASEAALSLAEDERELFHERLRAMKGVAGRALRWIGLSGLFVAGDAALRDEVEQLTHEHIADERAPAVLGRLLLGVGRAAPQEVAATWERALDAARQHGIEPLPLIGPIGYVIMHAESQELGETAARHLRAVAQREPFRDDPRTLELVELLGGTGDKP
ncbi:MAG: hypothetical protein HY908_18895 [Myxococcales bacterium]|nr:hypothetical protein [Myxococcales bacterium]